MRNEKKGKNYTLYVQQGCYLKKQGTVSRDEISAIEEEKENVVVLSTNLSFMTFPELISLRNREIFQFGIELNKVRAEFFPKVISKGKEEVGAWVAP